MTEQAKRGIAEDFLRGLRNRDGNLLCAIMADDVVWSPPGESLMSGEAHGVDAILSLAGFNVKIKLEHVIFGLRDVAVQLHNTGRSAGAKSTPFGEADGFESNLAVRRLQLLRLRILRLHKKVLN